MLEIFLSIHHNLLSQLNTKFQRYLVDKIDWNARALGVYGARGVGKTTMLLQQGLQRFGGPEKCLYVSADHVALSATGLYELGREFFQAGGDAIIIDEVHRAEDWSRHIKSLIDSFPQKYIWVSGSSALALEAGKADLSRRLVWYGLVGMSFREYLHLAHGFELKAVSLDDLVSHHTELARSIHKSRPSILADFRSYLVHGYYPFFMEGIGTYQTRLQAVIDKVLADDIPYLFNIERQKITALRKLLWLLVTSAPLSPNIEGLSRDIGIAKESVYLYLECLERAGLIKGLRANHSGGKLIRKPDKIYIANTNILYTIAGMAALQKSEGTIRETFLQSALIPEHSLHVALKADFIVDTQWTIEVGGAGKGFEQIDENDDKHILALDNVEFGLRQRVPLYLFGFVY